MKKEINWWNSSMRLEKNAFDSKASICTTRILDILAYLFYLSVCWSQYGLRIKNIESCTFPYYYHDA